MKPLTLEGLLRAAAVAACAMVAGMFAVFAATGIGQDPLQFLHAPADYAALLLKNPPVLRACFGLVEDYQSSDCFGMTETCLKVGC